MCFSLLKTENQKEGRVEKAKGVMGGKKENGRLRAEDSNGLYSVAGCTPRRDICSGIYDTITQVLDKTKKSTAQCYVQCWKSNAMQSMGAYRDVTVRIIIDPREIRTRKQPRRVSSGSSMAPSPLCSL